MKQSKYFTVMTRGHDGINTTERIAVRRRLLEKECRFSQGEEHCWEEEIRPINDCWEEEIRLIDIHCLIFIFENYTYNADTHNARTLTPMKVRT